MAEEGVREKGLKVSMTLKDERAIDIVKNIPKGHRDEVLEKYIILGEMVVSHAAISTRKENIDDFFMPLKSDIEMIRQQLGKIVPTIATPSLKGKVTAEYIFETLGNHFMDDQFEDVSTKSKYTDIKATTAETNDDILIEIKDHYKKVPSDEVEKFWRDMDLRDIKYGIFLSMRSGITKKSGPVNVETKMDRIGIFVVNNEFNWSGHLMAYYVIKKIIEIKSIKKRELIGEELDLVISRINRCLIEIQKNTETIEEIKNIADELLSKNTKRLGDLITLATKYKESINKKIDEALEEISKAEGG